MYEPSTRIGNQPLQEKHALIGSAVTARKVCGSYAGGARAGICRAADRAIKLMYWGSGPAPLGTRTQARRPATDGAMTRWHNKQVSEEVSAWWCQTAPSVDPSNSTRSATGIATRQVRIWSAFSVAIRDCEYSMDECSPRSSLLDI